MKKVISIPSDKMTKLQEKKEGTLQGGFASIKGGFNSRLDSTNESCSNTSDCTHSTNTGDPSCTNTHSCFM